MLIVYSPVSSMLRVVSFGGAIRLMFQTEDHRRRVCTKHIEKREWRDIHHPIDADCRYPSNRARDDNATKQLVSVSRGERLKIDLHGGQFPELDGPDNAGLRTDQPVMFRTPMAFKIKYRRLAKVAGVHIAGVNN